MDRLIAKMNRLACLLLGSIVGVSACLATAAEHDNPLPHHGFRQHGSRWVLKEEISLKRDLDALEELVRRTPPLLRQIELAVADNAQRWRKQQAANQLIDEIAAAMRATAVGTDEENKVQKQIDQLKKATRELRDGVAPDRLGGQPHMRAMLQSLTLMQQQANVLSLRIEAQMVSVQQTYEKLPQEISTWTEAHPEAKIGPLFRSEQAELATRRARGILNQSEIPVFLQGEQRRVGVVLNDEFPCVMTVDASERRLIITSNTALSAGLIELGEPQSITLPGGKKSQARSAVVQRLLVGSAMLQNVPAWVLDPSDECLGSVIGLELLQAWHPRLSESGVALSLDVENRISTASK